MLYGLQAKVLELFYRLKDEEKGQTSGEYVAVTAVAVLIAITVLYTAFQTSLSSAISTIGTELNTWVTNTLPG